MGSQPVGPPIDLGALTDEQLVNLHCANPAKDDAVTELWHRHGQPRPGTPEKPKMISRFLRMMVYKPNGICPRNWPKDTFLNASVSRAWVRFVNEICGVSLQEEVLSGWKWVTAERSALDEYRDIKRRSKKQFVQFDDAEDHEGDSGRSVRTIESLDPDAICRTPYFDGDAEESELVEILPDTLETHAEEDQDSAADPKDESEATHDSNQTRQRGRRRPSKLGSGVMAGPLPRPDVGLVSEQRKKIVRELLMGREGSEEEAESNRTIVQRYFRDVSVRIIAEMKFGASPGKKQSSEEKSVYRELDHDLGLLQSVLEKKGIRSLSEI